MEERIQRKVKELENKYTKEYFKTLRFKPTYEALREEAVQIIEKELAQEETRKKRIQEEQQEERARIEQSWKEAQEKQTREKKEEEEREQLKVIQQKEDPDRPLTIKDLRDIPGFDYNDYKRALEELNVEILKSIARETYAHKFNIKVNSHG